jgi:crotonobetainyl-CoA:carnitine CoA-transferase CaiB-like acyl-CoA transferase
MLPLRRLRVVDFSTEIAGPYCTKLLADAGADVVKVEPREGDPLRRWSSTGAPIGAEDGALFRFLNASKRSVVGSPEAGELGEMLAGADLVVESFSPGVLDVAGLRNDSPALVVLSVTPFGQSGPYARRPWTEFTVQAESGSIAFRGLLDQEPYQAGGRIGEWVTGAFGAVGALAAVYRARSTGRGEHVDVSMLDAMSLAGSILIDLVFRLLGIAEFPWPARTVETPSIEPTADGWVGFNTNTGQQFADFLVLIERADLAPDAELATLPGRMARREEWEGIVRAWTRRHTTAEIVARAGALRIPVAPVLDGKSVLDHEHFVARGVFVDDPSGTFKHPRRPYRIDGEGAPPARPAPQLGEHTGKVEARPARSKADAGHRNPLPPTLSHPGEGAGALPFAGLRVIDMTNWWAGPTATQVFAALGADVIHLESARRPDGVRMMGAMLAGGVERWWECASFHLVANANKRGLTLDLGDARGLGLMKRLVSESDLLVENYSPRVLDGFGLGREELHAINPRLIVVRMPAFGLDGPWRDNVGFAQTMEQISGLAWVTGHPDDQPRIQRGPCDPLAGATAAFAAAVALFRREESGRGSFVECPMVEAALNAAAEQVVEYTAYGNLMQRIGNRSPHAAPQGIYACLGHGAEREQWLALSIANDAQWEQLKAYLGNPAWGRDPALSSLPGRRAAQDRIDAELRTLFAARNLDALVSELTSAGIPAARVEDPRATSRHPQMAARGFYEIVAHPVAGTHPIPTLPFRYAGVERLIRTPAPTMGEHNREILCDLLGVTEEEFLKLQRDGVIGTRPAR